MLQRSIMIVALQLLATPAAAEWTLPCLFGGCSITFVSPEYAAKPVQPLDPEAALSKSTPTGRVMGGSRLSSMSVFLAPPLLNQRPRPGAAVWSRWVRCLEAHATRRTGRGSCEDRLGECRLRAEIVQRRYAQLGRKLGPSGEPAASSGDRCWVAMAKNSSGRRYWTLVLGAEKANAKKDEGSAKIGTEKGDAQPQPLTKEGCKTAGLKWKDQSNVCGLPDEAPLLNRSPMMALALYGHPFSSCKQKCSSLCTRTHPV